jgi:general secretion pathway protein A
VVLRLEQPPGGHVLAMRVGEVDVTLRSSGQDVQAPISQLDRRWLGDFYAVWRDSGTVWRSGDRDPAIAELKAVAASLPDEPWEGGVDPLYDAEFENWVESFQRRNGLTRDGMAGPVTRLFLSAFAEPADAPQGATQEG